MAELEKNIPNINKFIAKFENVCNDLIKKNSDIKDKHGCSKYFESNPFELGGNEYLVGSETHNWMLAQTQILAKKEAESFVLRKDIPQYIDDRIGEIITRLVESTEKPITKEDIEVLVQAEFEKHGSEGVITQEDVDSLIQSAIRNYDEDLKQNALVSLKEETHDGGSSVQIVYVAGDVTSAVVEESAQQINNLWWTGFSALVAQTAVLFADNLAPGFVAAHPTFKLLPIATAVVANEELNHFDEISSYITNHPMVCGMSFVSGVAIGAKLGNGYGAVVGGGLGLAAVASVIAEAREIGVQVYNNQDEIYDYAMSHKMLCGKGIIDGALIGFYFGGAMGASIGGLGGALVCASMHNLPEEWSWVGKYAFQFGLPVIESAIASPTIKAGGLAALNHIPTTAMVVSAAVGILEEVGKIAYDYYYSH